MSHKNSPWSRDELILALNLYFELGPGRFSATNPKIIHLSKILNMLNASSYQPDPLRFRNPNGVSMKLSNFLRFDPSYSGKGLLGGGRLEQDIWNEFCSDRNKLSKEAFLIRDKALYFTNESRQKDLANKHLNKHKSHITKEKLGDYHKIVPNFTYHKKISNKWDTQALAEVEKWARVEIKKMSRGSIVSIGNFARRSRYIARILPNGNVVGVKYLLFVFLQEGLIALKDHLHFLVKNPTV